MNKCDTGSGITVWSSLQSKRHLLMLERAIPQGQPHFCSILNIFFRLIHCIFTFVGDNKTAWRTVFSAFTANWPNADTLQNKTLSHQVTSKYVQFPGYNHLLTTSADDLTLWLSPERQVDSMVVTWWIVAFLHYKRLYLTFASCNDILC